MTMPMTTEELLQQARHSVTQWDEHDQFRVHEMGEPFEVKLARDLLARIERESQANSQIDELRKFLQFDGEPEEARWAWCCHCQESHPLDRPHVPADEHKVRMEFRSACLAELRGLKAEVERLAAGDFTDNTLNQLGREIQHWRTQARKRRKWLTHASKQREALKEALDEFLMAEHGMDGKPCFCKFPDGDHNPNAHSPRCLKAREALALYAEEAPYEATE